MSRVYDGCRGVVCRDRRAEALPVSRRLQDSAFARRYSFSSSSGAAITMHSGTENLDATARVVRRLVTFTDAGGEVNLILPGVNVGAQSYFDALATMGYTKPVSTKSTADMKFLKK